MAFCPGESTYASVQMTMSRNIYPYNLALTLAGPWLSFSDHSFNTCRMIFPLRFRGISSTKTTPPRSRLYTLTREFKKSWMSVSDTEAAGFLSELTTYARGKSLP